MARSKSQAVKRPDQPKKVDKKIQKVDCPTKNLAEKKKIAPKKGPRKLVCKKISPKESQIENSIKDHGQFDDIFKDVSSNLNTELKFQDSALKELQQSTEQFLNEWMEDTQICAKISNHETPSMRDLKLARRIRE